MVHIFDFEPDLSLLYTTICNIIEKHNLGGKKISKLLNAPWNTVKSIIEKWKKNGSWLICLQMFIFDGCCIVSLNTWVACHLN